MNKIMALDIATHTGWCVGSTPDQIEYGHMLLSNKDIGRTYIILHAHIDRYRPDLVVYEDVRRHMGHAARDCYFTYLAMTRLACSNLGIPVRGIGVGVWKMLTIGAGNADKPLIMQTIMLYGHNPSTQDEADAIGIWYAAFNKEAATDRSKTI